MVIFKKCHKRHRFFVANVAGILYTGWKKVDDKWDYLMPGNNKYTVELPGRLSGYGFNRDMNPENLRYLPKLLNSVAPSRIK